MNIIRKNTHHFKAHMQRDILYTPHHCLAETAIAKLACTRTSWYSNSTEEPKAVI